MNWVSLIRYYVLFCNWYLIKLENSTPKYRPSKSARPVFLDRHDIDPFPSLSRKFRNFVLNLHNDVFTIGERSQSYYSDFMRKLWILSMVKIILYKLSFFLILLYRGKALTIILRVSLWLTTFLIYIFQTSLLSFYWMSRTLHNPIILI